VKQILLFIFCFITMAVFAQQQVPVVSWSYEANKISNDSTQLLFKGSIQPGWKLFSITMKDDEPNTRLILDSSFKGRLLKVYEQGKLQETKEPLFDNAVLKYFTNEVIIIANVAALPLPGVIKGSISFMAQKGDEFVGPEFSEFRFEVDENKNVVAKSASLKETVADASSLKRNKINLATPVNNCGGTGTEDKESKGLVSIFVLGFLGGLVALLTPCVFPMIPLTVSFFTKKAQSRKKGITNALTYGFFIFLIYVLLSVPFHFLDSLNPEILNNISTNVWLNLVFFVVFVVFALSFFGLFEITLPSSFSNTVDSKAGLSGLAGIFFMALTLALVSFSCTGPILGSLLAGSLSTNGGAWQLTAGMGGFGFALALPFALFALFPNWLSAIPKSGGWLTTVKIVLGFIEVGLAIKFLSNADLVMHWGILKREVFFAIWIITSILLSLYLFGILKFKHEGPVKPGKLRIALGILVFAFALYLLPGLTNTKYANRALISGFPPPLTYSIYKHNSSKTKGVEANIVNDYDKALELAKKEHKPILIDFTGWACVNCRKMEENVWTQPAISEIITNNFILVSLYVDDRKLLPDDKQFLYTTASGDKKPIKTIGDKFATMETENFKNASQPLYAIINAQEQLLNRPVGYTPSATDYQQWLECGLEAAHKKK
jgi:thiol:disulfide interchange protein